MRPPHAAEWARRSPLDIIVFDKTGTLTTGAPRVVGVDVVRGAPDEALRLAADVEAGSSHPLARVIVAARRDPRSAGAATVSAGERIETPGLGVTLRADWGEARFGRRSGPGAWRC